MSWFNQPNKEARKMATTAATPQPPTGNKFVSFLKKIGAAIVKAEPIAVEVGSMAASFLPGGSLVGTIVGDISRMSNQAITVEAALQGKPGTEKLEALIPLIGQIVMTSEGVVGKEVADNDMFKRALVGYAQATVDMLNSLHPTTTGATTTKQA